MPKRGRESEHRIRQALQREHRSAPIVRLVQQFSEVEQQVDRQRCTGWSRVISHVARSGNQLLSITSGIEECANLIIPEPIDHLVGYPPRETYPFLVEGELVHREEAERDGGVVLEEA